MEWKENMSCNHGEIDNQHKKLIDIINKVSAAMVENKCDMEKLMEVINDLDRYIQVHFEFEEKLMLKYGFPSMEQHMFEHNKLRLKMKSIDATSIPDPPKFFSELLIYLVEWLTNHIMKTDNDLGRYIAMREME